MDHLLSITFTQEQLDQLPDVCEVGVKKAAQIAQCTSLKQFKLLMRDGLIVLDQNRTRWAPLEVMLAADKARIRPDNNGHTEVYFMAMGEFIKIGYSTSPYCRLDALQTATPYEIKLLGSIPGSIRDEERLHAKFSHLRHRGEWFKKSDSLMAYIAWLLHQAESCAVR